MLNWRKSLIGLRCRGKGWCWWWEFGDSIIVMMKSWLVVVFYWSFSFSFSFSCSCSCRIVICCSGSVWGGLVVSSCVMWLFWMSGKVSSGCRSLWYLVILKLCFGFWDWWWCVLFWFWILWLFGIVELCCWLGFCVVILVLVMCGYYNLVLRFLLFRLYWFG